MRFKAGDFVICNNRCHMQFTPGKTYEVGGVWQDQYEATGEFDYVGIVADDRGRPNGWSSDFFELVERPGPW